MPGSVTADHEGTLHLVGMRDKDRSNSWTHAAAHAWAHAAAVMWPAEWGAYRLRTSRDFTSFESNEKACWDLQYEMKARRQHNFMKMVSAT